jgi:phenylacetate-coenzyme A ligase PaaK-like adenylate-forming protein
MIAVTPLEGWIKKRTGIGLDLSGEPFSEALGYYQLRKVNEIVDYARRNTPFYRRHLASLPEVPLTTLSDITRIPFTTAQDIKDNPSGFLAVHQDDVARIVTLRTSGSTGEAKRLFFTEDDLELTIDFFHHGMSTMVSPGQKVAVLLPAAAPDSVGDLLVRGLQRMNVQSLPYGPIVDAVHAAEAIVLFGPQCLVGIPTQVLGVAQSRVGASIGKGLIENVLLTTDYCPEAIAQTLKRVWGCRVFTHYGMTETGLGGGVECEALDGYHLREGDLYFEIVDHETLQSCPDGALGEVVFTTLTRRGVPLIRYRTGDVARIIPEACPCGSTLRRMERVKGRWDGAVSLSPGCILTLPDMDEVLFQLNGLIDYQVTISKGMGGIVSLMIDVYRGEGDVPTEQEVLQTLNRIDAIRESADLSLTEKPIVRFPVEGRRATTGVGKRKIMVDYPVA